MSLPETISITCPYEYSNGRDKIQVIKALRCVFNLGLKEAKDLSETSIQHVIPVKLSPAYGQAYTDEDLYFEEQCRVLRNNGCEIGPTAYKILQSLRNLAADALKAGDDDLANEIMQLVLAEKLKRKP